MIRNVTDDEIKLAMFSNGENKALGPDGIKEGLHELVSMNQSAFVSGRRISDNILLNQELMHNYHRSSGPPRCAFKIDIQKAYDTVDWHFSELILKGFGFHPTMIEWIMTCVSMTSYSLCINGNLHGYFKGKRGLRQGSIIDVTSYKLQIYAFADDLFIFSRGETRSAKVIMESLNLFRDMSGLVASLTKSTPFFCNVPDHVKYAILAIMPFEEGSLPVWLRVKHLAKMHQVNSRWDDIYDWLIPRAKSNLARSVIGKLLVAASAYFIWDIPLTKNNWCNSSPLCDKFSPREIASAGFSIDNKVGQLVRDDAWYWQDRDGAATPFSVNVVWEDLRPRQASANWSDLAWTEPDSHNHLFFECSYTMQVWNKVNMKVVMCSRASNWNQIIDRFLPVAEKKTMENVIDILILAASMLTFKYKRKAHLERLIAAWDFPISLLDMAGLGHVLNIEDITYYLIPISKDRLTAASLGEISSGDVTGYAKPPLETSFLGQWVVDNLNAGVAAMQLQLMPNDKVVWFDTTALGPSALKLQPEGNCPLNPDIKNQPDCYAHAVAYDWKTSQVKPLTIKGDAWCSSGNLWPNGNLVATGGTFSGGKAIRVLANDDPNADFVNKLDVLAETRWYSSNQVLQDGSSVVVGGRDSYSYEIVPPQLDFQPKRFDLPFLKQTTEPPMGPGRPVENNLYPFLFLLPDGNIFMFANNRAISFCAFTGKVIIEYPELPGGSRNYPPSGMSAMFPLKLTPDNQGISAEIVVCGGNVPNAYKVVDARHVTEKQFLPALKDCHRIQPLKPNPTWEDEQDMPSPRTMGDLLLLPTGDLLMHNGAQKGCSGWEDSTDANFTPLLYTPFKPMGNRFKELTPTNIARMYHSASALLPDTKVLVAGSNMHEKYTFYGEFPTELRVEKFLPPYLDPRLDDDRPEIDEQSTEKVLKYGKQFKVAVKVKSKQNLELGDVMVTMLYPPFTTHGFSQNQRLLVPTMTTIDNNVITLFAPANGIVSPPGYYILFVNYLGVPGKGIWVHID
uniref:putative aldehyde oxidase Art an 7 n=1 Tax=Erigeron canadensis TaxID=72917 RepID=UPI001CB994E5|nr:putative aldehyde oxidase Art an 7 [Erigeron canadensis]